MKYLLLLGCIAMGLFLAACGHGSSSSAADSTQVNIDSLLNEAKASVDSLQMVDSLRSTADSAQLPTSGSHE
ncbi:MAG: hypothetical protein K6T34_08900 [Thermoflavifilum sp.]|nr:hypothetical protein [Thermoflavifilum sp.]